MNTKASWPYARGEMLSPAQKALMIGERTGGDPPPTADALVSEWRAGVDRALAHLVGCNA